MTSSEAAAGRLEKARGLLRQGYLKDALKILARLVSEAPATPGLNTIYGSALASAGHWAMASTYLKRALQNNLDQPEVLNNLAACHRAMGKAQEGLDNLDYALRLAPRFVDAWINKGNLHNDLGQPEKAALCFAKAVSLKPEDPGPWAALLNSQIQAGQAKKAVPTAKQAQDRFPDQEQFIALEIAALQASEDTQAALERARQWEQDSPNPQAALTYLGVLQASDKHNELPQEIARLKQKHGLLAAFDAFMPNDDTHQSAS